MKCNDKHRNCAAKREERNEWLTCEHGRASVLLESVVTESNLSAVERRAEVTLYKPSQAAEVTSRKRAKKPTQRRALQAIVPLTPITLPNLSKDKSLSLDSLTSQSTIISKDNWLLHVLRTGIR